MKTSIHYNIEFFSSLENSLKLYKRLLNSQLEHFGVQITFDQWQVLDIIVNYGDIKQSEIAAKTSKDTASVTRIIEILNTRGLVARQTDPNNRRKHLLKVSNQGEREFYKAGDVISKYSSAALEGIKEKRIRKLKKIFKTLSKNCT